MGLVVGVERQQDGADFGGGEHQHDPMRNVGGPERDLFAAFYPERHQSLGDHIHFFAKFKPGKPEIAVGIDDGVVFSAAGDGLIEQLTERVFAGYRHIVPRCAG